MIALLLVLVVAQPSVGPERAIAPLSTLEVPAVHNQLNPVIAANPQRGGVAWVDYRLASSLPSVFFRELNGLTGRPAGRNLLMSPSGGTAPAVAALSNGTFVVAWSDDTNVMFRLVGSPTISTPSQGLAPSLTAFDGGFLLAFSNPNDLFGQRFDNQGTAIDPSPRAIGTGGTYGAKSAGALVGDGSSAVVGWATSAGVATSLVSLTGGAPIPGGTLAVGPPDRIDAITTRDGGAAMLGRQANGGLIALVSPSLTISQLTMFAAGSDAPSSLVELPSGDLYTTLFQVPFGPRVSAALIRGGPVGPVLPLPITGFDVDVARSGNRLLFAAARTGNDVDLVISSTTLDLTDGGPPEVVATSNGSMEFPSVAGDGTGWLVVWEEPLPNERSQIAGVIVDSAGIVGAPFLVATDGARPTVAYAAGRYLVSFSATPTQAVAVSTTGVVGLPSFFASDVGPGKALSSLPVGSEVWVSYPSSQNFAVARLFSDGGYAAGLNVVTATGYEVDGTQMVTLASGAHQAVWMDSSGDRFLTAMVDPRGGAGAPVVFLTGVSGARPLAHAVADDVIVLAYLGGVGLRLMRLSGTTVIDSQTVPLGRNFSSTLGLSIAQTPEGLYAAMTVEGDNRLELLPLDTSNGRLRAGTRVVVASNLDPYAGTAMARNGNAVLLVTRQFQFTPASMQLRTALLTFRSPDGGVDAGGTSDAGTPDGGADAGSSDAGTPDGGSDAGTADGGADAGETPDAGTPDGGADAGERSDAGLDGGTVDAGATDSGVIDGGFVDAGLPGLRSYGIGCGCGAGAGLEGVVLGLVVLIVRRRR